MKTLYFTATGNSLYAAKRVGGELLSIPQLERRGQYEIEGEAVGFVYPCYGFGVPGTLTRFLERARIRADYVFAVMTYGKRSQAGLAVFERLLKAHGIPLHYANEVLMVDNFLPMFRMEEQIAKQSNTLIDGALDAIAADIRAREKRIHYNLMENPIRAMTQELFARYGGGVDCTFHVSEACNGCKTCARVCPRGNIRVSERPRYQGDCAYCMACVHHCPRGAIHVDQEKGELRFRNEHITLQEIIAANEQDARA